HGIAKLHISPLSAHLGAYKNICLIFEPADGLVFLPGAHLAAECYMGQLMLTNQAV
ncbi:hypothetical protein MBAV_004442, partial [Candidatus Magnetobacterium bavaricum]